MILNCIHNFFFIPNCNTVTPLKSSQLSGSDDMYVYLCGVLQEALVKILTRLTDMQHPNIVNFMSFWHDKVMNQDRVSYC